MKVSCVRTSLLLALAVALPGCSWFLPAHSRSNKRKGETVEIKMLDLAQMEPYKDAYKTVFGRDMTEDAGGKVARAPVPKAIPLMAAAAGFAVDYVEKELRKEAKLYEAQFGSIITGDEFWKHGTAGPPGNPVSVWKQNYYGIEISRSLRGYDQVACKVVYGIAVSADGQMFRIAPLSFVTNYAKAKVVTDEGAWWLAPTTWFPRLTQVRVTGHEIDTTVELEIDAYWRTEKNELRISQVAGFPVRFSGYSLASCDELRPGAGLPEGPSGWLLSVPVSHGVVTDTAGTFTVKALVTERDTSNAQKYLLEAAELVADRKAGIVSAVAGDDGN